MPLKLRTGLPDSSREPGTYIFRGFALDHLNAISKPSAYECRGLRSFRLQNAGAVFDEFVLKRTEGSSAVFLDAYSAIFDQPPHRCRRAIDCLCDTAWTFDAPDHPHRPQRRDRRVAHGSPHEREVGAGAG